MLALNTLTFIYIMIGICLSVFAFSVFVTAVIIFEGIDMWTALGLILGPIIAAAIIYYLC